MTGLCIHEQPPYCNAACPLRLDVRALMAAVSAGNFKKALQIYEKATPFPAILSKGCEAPCEAKCKLCELGDGISVKAIEAAVAQFGERTLSGGVFRTRKKKKIAIIGDDLFCLFLAGELEKKMYPMTVFTSAPDLNAFLASLGAEEEFSRIKGMDIEFAFNAVPSLSLTEDYDVVCASEACARLLYPDAVCNESLMVYEEKKLVMGAGQGVLAAAFGAKKAAMSVDRLAQNLDPSNSRGEEGSVETSLYTSTEGVTAVKRVEIVDRETAVEEAKRCLQCECRECMKACAFLEHYGKYPDLIGREIYNNTQIIMGTHPLNEAMNTCTLCGQCKVVCPNHFDMATICQHARQNMVSTDKMPLSQHEFALLDMYFSNEEAFLCRPQPGYDRCRYVFFPGCQACAVAPETVRAAYEDLCSRLEGGVALMLGCCSVMAKWSGRDEIYEQQKAFLRAELEKLGNPVIIAGCPTCQKELSAEKGIWDVLNEIGLPPQAEGLKKPAALHDSCGARGNAEVQQSVRALAEKLGLSLVDAPYTGDEALCCGYGGLTAYANKPVAREITRKALEGVDVPYISYCMACRDRFAREGHESRHILEMVYGTDAGSPPDISEKRFNRLSLKQNLLKDIWGEECESMETAISVEYTEEALQLMDDRFILKTDVEQVLSHALESGEEIYDEDSRLFISCFRPGNVTFWVKYEKTETGFRVHRAWSHRMFIQTREG